MIVLSIQTHICLNSEFKALSAKFRFLPHHICLAVCFVAQLTIVLFNLCTHQRHVKMRLFSLNNLAPNSEIMQICYLSFISSHYLHMLERLLVTSYRLHSHPDVHWVFSFVFYYFQHWPSARPPVSWLLPLPYSIAVMKCSGEAEAVDPGTD